MTREITQEERLDLTDIREEAEAYNRKLSDYCEAFGIDSKKVKEEYYHDIAVNSDEYKKLETENEKLKIKNNKMKRLLKDLDYWLGQELNLNCFKGEIMSFVLTKDYIMEEQKKKIEEVLKKVEE